MIAKGKTAIVTCICAFIERPSPPEKPSCKVRLFVQNRSRKYCQKVTVTDSISNHFSSHFSTSHTNAPRLLSQAKAGTHSAFGERSHTAAHTPKQGPSERGCYHYPRTVSHVSETLRGRGLKRQTLPLLGLGRGYSRRTQRACGTAMRLCASLSRRRRGPAGLRDLFTFVEVAACTPCAQGLSACARRGVVSPLLVCSACC